MRRDEAGVATVWGIAMMSVLALLAVLGVAVIGVVAGHRRAQAAADLAAVAGASTLRDGEDACAAARGIAARNGAQLLRCTVEGRRVGVVVSTSVRSLFDRTHELRARSVAGPEITP